MKTKKLLSRAFVSRLLFYAAVVFCTHGSGTRADESQWLLSPDVSVASTGSGAANGMAPASPTKLTGKNSIRTVGSSLALVLGGFLLLSVLLRKPQHRAATSQLIENLGAVHITPKVKLHLVRFGSRILVLHLASSAVQCVAELSEPDEVQRILMNEGDEGSSLSPQVDELLRASDSRSLSELLAEV